MNWYAIIELIVKYGPTLAKLIKDFDSNPRKWLQKALNDVLTPSPNLVVDGKIGPKTIAAVEQFQKDNGLTVDGIPGLITQLVLTQVLTRL